MTKRTRVVGLVVAAGLLVVAVVLAVLALGGSGGDDKAPAETASNLSNDGLVGQRVELHPGADGRPDSGDERNHLAAGATMTICSEAQLVANTIAGCYNSNPPTSGPHAPLPAQWGVLTAPATKEALVHNMEHGGVVVWYNTNSAQAVNLLRQAVTDAVGKGRLVVMSRYDGLDVETVALTGWGRLDKFPVQELSRERVERFIADHERRYNPEGF